MNTLDILNKLAGEEVLMSQVSKAVRQVLDNGLGLKSGNFSWSKDGSGEAVYVSVGGLLEPPEGATNFIVSISRVSDYVSVEFTHMLEYSWQITDEGSIPALVDDIRLRVSEVLRKYKWNNANYTYVGSKENILRYFEDFVDMPEDALDNPRAFVDALSTVVRAGIDLPDTTLAADGCTLMHIQHVSASSELPQALFRNTVCASDVVVLQPAFSFTVHSHSSSTLYIFTEDFVNDANIPEIYNQKPQPISGEWECVTLKEPVLELCGDLTIRQTVWTDSPGIDTSSVSEVTIKGNGFCLDISTLKREPAIGIKTHDGMSYGRWCPGSGKKLERIILDNVHVKLQTEVPNFSIGAYGLDYVPEVVLLNGATIEYPENGFTRVMLKSGAEDLYGSTKREAPAIYGLQGEL